MNGKRLGYLVGPGGLPGVTVLVWEPDEKAPGGGVLWELSAKEIEIIP